MATWTSFIVGSAAFNLFCINAVCVGAIPEPVVITIKEVQVFVITATLFVFAYLWLLIFLLGRAKKVVKIWEGVLTLRLLPILVFFAYLPTRSTSPREPHRSTN